MPSWLLSPGLYDSGFKEIELIKQGREMATTSSSATMASIFSGCQVIVNRLLHHIEMQGVPYTLDLLVSAGTQQKLSLVFQNWGLSVLYAWRFVAVGERCFFIKWETGQGRGSVFPYMNDKVHECLEVGHPNWPRERDYCLLLENRLEIQSENDLFIFKVT